MPVVSRFLNIAKPAGISSRAVVDQVVRVVGDKRVGHAGTLDPAATGVLVIAIGKATRLVEYVQQLPKVYEAVFVLGATSNTDDAEGAIVETPNAVAPSRQQIETCLSAFVGEIVQRPPAFSAVKVAGKRAYDLARSGRIVELEPRVVRVDSIDLLDYQYPLVKLRIVCGGGTYIRSIARDLGQALGVGGLMRSLCRAAIGHFRLESAVPLDELAADNWLSHSWTLEQSLDHLATVRLSASDEAKFNVGQVIVVSDAPLPATDLRLVSSDGRFLGIGVFDAAAKCLRPTKGGF